MSEKKMLPCPFCGAEADYNHVDLYQGGIPLNQVFCSECRMRGPRASDKDRAIHGWNAPPRALRWTNEPPTKPGWYWWREGRNEDRLVAHVFIGAHTSGQKYLYAQFAGEGDIVHKIKEMGGEFAGPIPEPKEK